MIIQGLITLSIFWTFSFWSDYIVVPCMGMNVGLDALDYLGEFLFYKIPFSSLFHTFYIANPIIDKSIFIFWYVFLFFQVKTVEKVSFKVIKIVSKFTSNKVILVPLNLFLNYLVSFITLNNIMKKNKLLFVSFVGLESEGLCLFLRACFLHLVYTSGSLLLHFMIILNRNFGLRKLGFVIFLMYLCNYKGFFFPFFLIGFFLFVQIWPIINVNVKTLNSFSNSNIVNSIISNKFNIFEEEVRLYFFLMPEMAAFSFVFTLMAFFLYVKFNRCYIGFFHKLFSLIYSLYSVNKLINADFLFMNYKSTYHFSSKREYQYLVRYCSKVLLTIFTIFSIFLVII